MRQLWARVGMQICCTDEEYEKLQQLVKTDEEAARELIWNLIFFNHEFTGESYLPGGVDENPNEEDFEF